MRLRTFCINLDRRPDRLERFYSSFQGADLDIERLPAVDGSNIGINTDEWTPAGYPFKRGAAGCSLTHMVAHRMAMQMGLDSFLIMEDDCSPTGGVAQFNESLAKVMADLPSDWDLLYLGGNHWHGELASVTDTLSRTNYTLTTHAVAFRHTVFDLFARKLVDLSKPCDVHYAESHRGLNAYVATPQLAFQVPDFSDVQEQYMDYTFIRDS